MASMVLEAEVGMLIVETIAKIRRAFFVQGKPIKVMALTNAHDKVRELV